MPSEGYVLLDSGGGQKLEQVGPYVLRRQAAAAWWRPRLPDARWAQADGIHHRDSKGGGRWELRRPVPETWNVRYAGLDLAVRCTPFGHLGLFAEHARQWAWVDGLIRARAARGPVKVLNLFAYTGGASLACARAGARVTHVDAAKSIVDWARRNAALSAVPEGSIQWAVEDVPTFVGRELRRGNRYHGIILDPPSFGRGSRNEVWNIEEHVQVLLERLSGLLDPDPLFFLLSAHSNGFGPIALQNLLTDALGSWGEADEGEMVTPHEDGRLLPAGSFARRAG